MMNNSILKVLACLLIFTILSCEAEEEKTSAPETPKESIDGTFTCEKHWVAYDGINETNHWFEIHASATGLVYNYKYKNYFSGQGWTFSEGWDSWVSKFYIYEISGTQIRMKSLFDDVWPEWTEYILTDTSLTITIDGTTREYLKQQ